MTIKRLDHVSVVVDDLPAAIAFFTALGMTLEGEAPIEGPWVDRVNGIEGVQVDIVMMRTPDGHGRLELTKFRNPKLVEIEPAIAPPNALGLRSVMFTVESVDDTVARLRANGAELSARWPSTRTSTDSATCEAPRASSSRWPRSSPETAKSARNGRARTRTLSLKFVGPNHDHEARIVGQLGGGRILVVGALDLLECARELQVEIVGLHGVPATAGFDSRCDGFSVPMPRP